jgi:hypothetical protein
MTWRPCLACIAGLAIGTAGSPSLAGASLAGTIPAGPAPAGSGLPAGSLAQNDRNFSGVRALNLARNHAVKLNGGLGTYRPAACMFSTEWSGSECLLRRDDSGFLFRFLGGPPGWQQLNLAPTVETEILIAPDGRAVVQLIHNGPPRQSPPSPDTPSPSPAPGVPQEPTR